MILRTALNDYGAISCKLSMQERVTRMISEFSSGLTSLPTLKRTMTTITFPRLLYTSGHTLQHTGKCKLYFDAVIVNKSTSIGRKTYRAQLLSQKAAPLPRKTMASGGSYKTSQIHSPGQNYRNIRRTVDKTTQAMEIHLTAHSVAHSCHKIFQQKTAIALYPLQCHNFLL